jgi:myosin heavy subunit
MRGEYLPGMDSLKTSLAFLQQNNQLLGNAKEIQQKAQGAMGNVTQLQSKLQQSEQVKAFIQQRKQQIKEALGKYTKLPKGISNSVTDFNKEVYYYGQQLREYKDMLKDPDKMVQKGLTLLNKLPAFKQFMAQHSELASLFRLPDNYGTPQSLAG